MRRLDRLANAAALAIGRGARTDSPGARAVAYREAAEALVEARSHFLDADGEPDWRGRTYDYRRWAGEVYSSSGITGEERTTAQAAIRYHVGNVLRDRLDDETLEALGLRAVSPRERSQEQRTERSTLLRAVTGSSSGFAGVDGLRALTATSALLERVEPASMRDLDADGRRVARGSGEAISRRADALSEALATTRPRRK